MIGNLAAAVAIELNRRLFPHPVSYAPLRVAHDGFSPAIVFKRDRDAGDPILPPLGAKDLNPEVPYNREVSGSVVIYARSSKPAATALDHENECDRVCDGVLTAMYDVLSAKKLPLRIVDSRIMRREDLRAEAEDTATDKSGARSADAPGCAARIRFAVRTCVRRVTYTGAARPTGAISDVATVVTSDGYPDFDPVDLPIPP